MDRVNPFRRVRIGLAALALVLLGGTVGYLLFGFDLIDALYQTVITVTTVGFNSRVRSVRAPRVSPSHSSSWAWARRCTRSRPCSRCSSRDTCENSLGGAGWSETSPAWTGT